MLLLARVGGNTLGSSGSAAGVIAVSTVSNAVLLLPLPAGTTGWSWAASITVSDIVLGLAAADFGGDGCDQLIIADVSDHVTVWTLSDQ
jgi:hypothetical protein